MGRRLWLPCFFALNLLLGLVSLAGLADAQRIDAGGTSEERQQSSQEQAQQKQSPQPDAQQSAPEQNTTPENDRLFGVLPNYLTVENEARVPPLTRGGKFRLVAKNAFDPAIYPFIGFLALVGQATDSEPEYGQGAAGYGRRYGASFGDAAVGSFMTGAVFPSIFKQDPRYYQLVHGGFKARSLYAVSRIFITRSDSGHRQFNASEVIGNLVAAGISQSYHPAEDRSLPNTLSVWGTDIGWDTTANLAQEFWPDIHRWLKRKFTLGNT
jgi:hypothetical protein